MTVFRPLMVVAICVGMCSCSTSQEDTLNTATASLGGPVELNTNVIQGTARFTNTNPEVLRLLTAAHARTGSASASSTRPPGLSASTESVEFSSPTELRFSMLVEAGAGGEQGVTYDVKASWGSFEFPVHSGVTVRPRHLQPEPSSASAEACVGVVQFQFGADESCQSPSSAFRWAKTHGLSAYPLGNSQTLVGYVRPGERQKAYIEYNYWARDSEGRNVNLVAYKAVEWSVRCDEIVRICTAVRYEPVPATGELTGPFEIAGEPLTVRGGVSGQLVGTPIYTGTEVPRDAPTGDPASWWRLRSLLPGEWQLYGGGAVRRGREFTTFRTPFLAPGSPGGTATVVAGQTTPLTKVIEGQTRHAFAMSPAYYYGTIRLVDPSVPLRPGSYSTLQSLFFASDYDDNRDGIPDISSDRSTVVHSFSTANATGGGVWSAFPGRFNPASGELNSTYEQMIPNPYDQTIIWHNALVLGFWSEGASTATRPGLYDPERFRYGDIGFLLGNRAATLGPGDRYRLDHEYCFNEVQLQYSADFGRFYNPRVEFGGRNAGRDWRGHEARYHAGGKFYGTPYVSGYDNPQSYAQQGGSIYMVLPQGSFGLTPKAMMVGDDGSVSETTFAPLSVTLGCGQRLRLVPPLSVMVSPLPTCASGPAVPLSGMVRSEPAEVDRIWYRLNGGPEVTVCTNCGRDPNFSFTLPLRSCHNDVQVFAYTEGMPNPATSFAEITWDDPADGPSCPGSTCVNRPPVARCRSVTVPTGSACNGCGSVDDGSYDPDTGDQVRCTQEPACPYALGTQRVQLSCTDSGGLSSSCEATVTVKDKTPPVLTCPEVPALECRGGSASASFNAIAADNCGSSSITCSPASGTRFPLGTSTTVCTATDAAGNSGKCTASITVQDTQPPTVTCQEPFTAECNGNRQVTLATAPANATDACQPPTLNGPTSFPVGQTTEVTYTATDSRGQQAACTTAVTAVDTVPPTLRLNGPSSITLSCGDGRYVEPGFEALDICHGDLTSRVTVSGTVDHWQPGTYTLTYQVADPQGNRTSATRVIRVLGRAAAGAQPAWSSTGSLSRTTTRLLHTATLLVDGRVLAVGGYGRSTELYDPLLGIWLPSGDASVTRRYHTATRLVDGRVLVAGGANGQIESSAELYEPATGTWSVTGRMTAGRREHTATLLRDGQVLVVGGGNSSRGATAELYDPATGTWTATGPMSTSRRQHSATLLRDGRVLVVGGLDDSSTRLRAAELYDPSTSTWRPAGLLSIGRGLHTATLLDDGRVLVAGGVQGSQGTTAELYDPSAGTWVLAGSMGWPRSMHSATLLPSGRVLVAGGYDRTTGSLTSAELYDPCTSTWAPTASMSVERYRFPFVLLGDGRVLAVGGFSSVDQSSVEMYNPSGM